MEALLVKCADNTETGGERSHNGHRSVINQADLIHKVKLVHLINMRLKLAKCKVMKCTKKKNVGCDY